jgi:hypothetical protein
MASKYELGGTCAWRGCRKSFKGELPHLAEPSSRLYSGTSPAEIHIHNHHVRRRLPPLIRTLG